MKFMIDVDRSANVIAIGASDNYDAHVVKLLDRPKMQTLMCNFV